MHGMPQSGHTGPTTPRILCSELMMPCARKDVNVLMMKKLDPCQVSNKCLDAPATRRV